MTDRKRSTGIVITYYLDDRRTGPEGGNGEGLWVWGILRCLVILGVGLRDFTFRERSRIPRFCILWRFSLILCSLDRSYSEIFWFVPLSFSLVLTFSRVSMLLRSSMVLLCSPKCSELGVYERMESNGQMANLWEPTGNFTILGLWDVGKWN